MTNPATFDPSANAMRFTDAAAAKARNLIEAEDNKKLHLRVFVNGGGCSGFEYGFAFDDDLEDDDTCIDNNGVTLVVDALSYQYLVGSTVDFKEDLQGARFVVENPNATTTCGCGNSFSI